MTSLDNISLLKWRAQKWEGTKTDIRFSNIFSVRFLRGDDDADAFSRLLFEREKEVERRKKKEKKK